MTGVARTLAFFLSSALILGCLTVAYLVATGVSARPTPGAFETLALARSVVWQSVPALVVWRIRCLSAIR
jgi:Na+/H+ antiporter NhaC